MKPKSLSGWLFLITGAIFLLQLFPFTGIFLMMLGAPYWSVVTLNLAFILIFVDVKAGHLPKVILILPVLYFGGYLAAAILSHILLSDLQSDVESINAAVRVPFDPQQNVISFKNDESSNFASSFLQTADLSVVYSQNSNYPPFKNRACRLMSSGIGNDFEAIRHGFYVVPIYSKKSGIHMPSGLFLGTILKGRVIVCYPEDPEQPIFTVDIEQKKFEGRTLLPHSFKQWLLTTNEQMANITTPDGNIYRLRGGTAAPLKWIPMPIMGCALNDSPSSWDCDAVFDRNMAHDVNKTGIMSVIADTLGIHQIDIEDRPFPTTDPGWLKSKLTEIIRATPKASP
jgi:hypothetical protein